MKRPAPLIVACVLTWLTPAGFLGPALHAAGRPVTPSIGLDLRPSGRITPAVVEAALDEVQAIWGANHIKILGPDASRCVRIPVILLETDAGGGPGTGVPLGALRFENGLPENRIQVFIEPVEALGSRQPSNVLPLWRMTPADHDRVLARVLGRVVAHEIGHYLLRSEAHTSRGLMRASHSVADFVGESRVPFLPTPDEGQRAAWTAASVEVGVD